MPTWTELVAPCVQRCELASKLGMQATWNADGADALGKLLQEMATRLDQAVGLADLSLPFWQPKSGSENGSDQ